jgi:hypothetical protein
VSTLTVGRLIGFLLLLLLLLVRWVISCQSSGVSSVVATYNVRAVQLIITLKILFLQGRCDSTLLDVYMGMAHHPHGCSRRLIAYYG